MNFHRFAERADDRSGWPANVSSAKRINFPRDRSSPIDAINTEILWRIDEFAIENKQIEMFYCNYLSADQRNDFLVRRDRRLPVITVSAPSPKSRRGNEPFRYKIIQINSIYNN